MNVSETILENILGRIRFKFKEGPVQNLDDYLHTPQGAKDLLDAFRGLILNGHLRYEGSQCPSESDCRNAGLPLPEGGVLEVEQRTGQLMGSRLSFPFLCLANYSCLVMCTHRLDGSYFPFGKERYHKALKGGMVQINGDDILFPVPSLKFYDRWSSFLPVFGFTKSLGKNWVHQKFFTINSELYYINVSSQTHTLSLRKLEYFESGLLIGQHKVSGRLESRALPPGAVLELVLRSARNPLRAYQQFLFYNRNWIKSATSLGVGSGSGFPNLFLPIPFGGLGVRPRPQIEFRTTGLQRAVAGTLLDLYHHRSMSISDYSRVTGSIRSTHESAVNVPKVPITGFVGVRRALGAHTSEPVALLDRSFKIPPLVVPKEDQGSISTSYEGVRLFRHILKKKKHVETVLPRDFKFDNLEVVQYAGLRFADIGSDESSSKTVEQQSRLFLNNSVLSEQTDIYQGYDLPNRGVTHYEKVVQLWSYSGPTHGMSRDCTEEPSTVAWSYDITDLLFLIDLRTDA